MSHESAQELFGKAVSIVPFGHNIMPDGGLAQREGTIISGSSLPNALSGRNYGGHPPFCVDFDCPVITNGYSPKEKHGPLQTVDLRVLIQENPDFSAILFPGKAPEEIKKISEKVLFTWGDIARKMKDYLEKSNADPVNVINLSSYLCSAMLNKTTRLVKENGTGSETVVFSGDYKNEHMNVYKKLLSDQDYQVALRKLEADASLSPEEKENEKQRLAELNMMHPGVSAELARKLHSEVTKRIKELKDSLDKELDEKLKRIQTVGGQDMDTEKQKALEQHEKEFAAKKDAISKEVMQKYAMGHETTFHNFADCRVTNAVFSALLNYAGIQAKWAYLEVGTVRLATRSEQGQSFSSEKEEYSHYLALQKRLEAQQKILKGMDKSNPDHKKISDEIDKIKRNLKKYLESHAVCLFKLTGDQAAMMNSKNPSTRVSSDTVFVADAYFPQYHCKALADMMSSPVPNNSRAFSGVECYQLTTGRDGYDNWDPEKVTAWVIGGSRYIPKVIQPHAGHVLKHGKSINLGNTQPPGAGVQKTVARSKTLFHSHTKNKRADSPAPGPALTEESPSKKQRLKK